MKLETVAEGIERLDEMLVLRRQGCSTGQGYHFCPPLPADELYPLLTDGTWIRGIREESATLA